MQPPDFQSSITGKVSGSMPRNTMGEVRRLGLHINTAGRHVVTVW
jgi:hypothetical protein